MIAAITLSLPGLQQAICTLSTAAPASDPRGLPDRAGDSHAISLNERAVRTTNTSADVGAEALARRPKALPMFTHIGLIGSGTSPHRSSTPRAQLVQFPSVNIAAIYGPNTATMSSACAPRTRRISQPRFQSDTSRPPSTDGPRHDRKLLRTPRQGRHRRRSSAAFMCSRKNPSTHHRSPRRRSHRSRETITRKARGDQAKIAVKPRRPAAKKVDRTKAPQAKILFVDARAKWSPPAPILWQIKMTWDAGVGWRRRSRGAEGVHTVDLLLWLLGDVTRPGAHRHRPCTHRIRGLLRSPSLNSPAARSAHYKRPPPHVRAIRAESGTGSEGTVILEHDRIIAADIHNPPQTAGFRHPSVDAI